MDRCLEVFDANCPAFFAPGERDAYAAFLRGAPPGYEVCLVDTRLVGAFGLFVSGAEAGRLHWILVHPEVQGMGVGSAMMQRAMSRARDSGLARIDIAASHRSEPFFQAFGATTIARVEDGWGPGMHRHDMGLELSSR